MSRVGFLGLGVLGRPMAERLVRVGHQVVVWNRSPEKALPLLETGATAAASAADAVASTEFAVLMLRDGPVTRMVLDDVGEALAGRTVIQMATIAPHESIELAALVARHGGRYLEAPVLGSVPQAKAGPLQVLTAGDPGDIERARELLARIAAPTSGVVLLGSEASPNEYYYYYSRSRAKQMAKGEDGKRICPVCEPDRELPGIYSFSLVHGFLLAQTILIFVTGLPERVQKFALAEEKVSIFQKPVKGADLLAEQPTRDRSARRSDSRPILVDCLSTKGARRWGPSG